MPSQRGISSELIKPLSQLVAGSASASIQHQGADFLRKWIGFCRGQGRQCADFLNPAHHGLQLTLVRVVDKQLFGQRRLVVEHVNQETQRPKVVAELIKNALLGHRLAVTAGNQHGFNGVTHLQHGV